jgi:hypothetical protein
MSLESDAKASGLIRFRLPVAQVQVPLGDPDPLAGRGVHDQA